VQRLNKMGPSTKEKPIQVESVNPPASGIPITKKGTSIVPPSKVGTQIKKSNVPPKTIQNLVPSFNPPKKSVDIPKTITSLPSSPISGRASIISNTDLTPGTSSPFSGKNMDRMAEKIIQLETIILQMKMDSKKQEEEWNMKFQKMEDCINKIMISKNEDYAMSISETETRIHNTLSRCLPTQSSESEIQHQAEKKEPLINEYEDYDGLLMDPKQLDLLDRQLQLMAIKNEPFVNYS